MHTDENDFWAEEIEARDKRNKNKITPEENEKFKAMFDSDHPDFAKPSIKTKEEIMYDGMSREEWWKSKERIYPKKFSQFDKSKLKKTNLVYNQVLGYQKQEVIDYAIENGLIIKKKLWENVYWCIPTVEQTVRDNRRGIERSVQLVDPRFLEFKQQLKDGSLKIRKDKLL